jgi:acetyl-CoA acetyltransferase family protein
MPAEWTISLGETAERVAHMYGLSRREQDEFGLKSQRRAEAAIRANVFADEMVPVSLPVEDGKTVAKDEPPRPGLTIEALSKLEPAFAKGGTVTAGTSSGINDGAAALSVVSTHALEELGLEPLAQIVGTAVAGVDPSRMGLGPIPATRKALERAKISVDQLDVIELNEAFAAQAIACIRELELDPAKVNIYGGAIALGHPLGASGARILTTLVHALRRTRGRYGLATMCIGVGQGIAVVVEATRARVT